LKGLFLRARKTDRRASKESMDMTHKKTVKISSILIFCFILLALFAGDMQAASKKEKKKWVKSKHGTSALLKLSRDRSEMMREYQKETHSYNRLKKAIGAGSLKPGDSAKDVKRKIGDPVIVLKENDGKTTRWVFKPHSASYFSDEKIYLFFDENNKLIRGESPGK